MTEQVPFSPSEPFRYCPADGKRLSDLRPSGGATCPLCGRSWYRNSAPAVGTVIVEDGKALLTLRAREPEKGRLDLPGGFLGVGEHPVDGLAREAREELGVEIEVLEPPILLATHTYGPAGQYVLAIGFRARIVAGEPEPTDDVAAIRWVSAEEVDSADFAWKHDRRRWPERLSAARSLPVLVAGMSPTRGRRSQRAPLREVLVSANNVQVGTGRYSVGALQERGVRVTPQRAHIWRVLIESGEHFTADEIWERVKGTLPGLELSTVYRSLEALRAAGLVAESRLPEGPRVFEARPALHPHLVCEVCGGIFHPDSKVGQRLFETLNAGAGGFEVRELHVTAGGICAGCARQKGGS